MSTSSLNNDSRFSHAQRLPSKFGVTESCPAIRHAVDQEQQGVVRVWLLALQTGLEYKALRVSTKMSALDVVKHLLEKLDMVDDPLRYYLVEVSGKKGGMFLYLLYTVSVCWPFIHTFVCAFVCFPACLSVCQYIYW